LWRGIWSAPANALARAVRHDHLVDIAAFRRHERIGEVLLIFVDALFECCGCLDALGGSARRRASHATMATQKAK